VALSASINDGRTSETSGGTLPPQQGLRVVVVKDGGNFLSLPQQIHSAFVHWGVWLQLTPVSSSWAPHAILLRKDPRSIESCEVMWMKENPTEDWSAEKSFFPLLLLVGSNTQ